MQNRTENNIKNITNNTVVFDLSSGSRLTMHPNPDSLIKYPSKDYQLVKN